MLPSASVGRPETTSPIAGGSTIERAVSWTPLPLPLNDPESAYRTILQKLPRNPDTAAMALFLAELSGHIAPGAHAVVVLDGAGWHTARELRRPGNVSPLPLPAYSCRPTARS